jgi:GT2 family glycosyltransferase
MRETQCGHIRTAITKALLHIRVNLDALAAEPGPYLQAVYWRIRGLKLRSRHRFSAIRGNTARAYDLWMVTREPERAMAIPVPPDAVPPVAIVVDCRVSEKHLDRTLASISTQTCDNAEFVLLGGRVDTKRHQAWTADPQELAEWLLAFAQRSGCSEPWVIYVSAGDALSPLALAAYRSALRAAPQTPLFYADDDLIGPDSRRKCPHFKPEWNPELFQHLDFLTGSCMFAVDPAAVDGEWPFSALPLASAPRHIPHVLHHRVARPAAHRPQLPAFPVELPHVSIVVPTRNGVDLLRTCMEGLAKTRYPSFDVTVIDNESEDPEALAFLDELERRGNRIVRHAEPFNYAAMHNRVVPTVIGPLVCLLNNDIEIIDLDWLRIMAMQTLNEDVGAVGAMLLYPDRTIQHAGIVIGIGGGAGHAHRTQPDDAAGYFDRAHLPQYISAVTAACLVVRKDRFEAVGGFDAEHFAVAFNDVDLCLKLNARGWQSFYEPRACLVHHESKSRGQDKSGPKKARYESELAALKRIWSTDDGNDRYHHPELSQFGERFVVRL